MALNKQMEMFEDGGLMDEGGSVDPVSGNDVPPGSTQEEVRDDIPAQLSEGEFVFPADVVRFIGLNNLMQMRQQAKMGLKQMEEMGQMGNSEEATMPDDLPFDINDLDIEDELEYNVGGFVPGTVQQQQYGISGMQQAATPTTGVAAAPTQAASQQFVQPVRPQQAAVPTMPAYQPSEIPTFKGFVGENIPGVEFEYVDYTNEAGNIIKLRKSKTTGELLDPVPEGYTFVDPEATKTEEVTTTPTTPQTTSVREDEMIERDTPDDGLGPGGGRIGLGGFSVGDGTKKGATIVGVSFDNMGGLPGVAGAIQGIGKVIGGKIPSNAEVTFTYDNEKITIMGDEYQELKDLGFKGDKATSIQRGLQVASAAKRNTLDYNPETKTFVDKKSGQTFTDDDDNSILTNAGRSIYSNVDKNDLIKSGQSLSTSQKAIASAYNDLAFQDFMDDINEMDSESSDSGNNQNQSSGEGRTSSTNFGRDDRGDSSYDPGGTSDPGQEQDFGNSSTGGYYDFNKGGLAAKPKPKKTKKMKKGGLASKK